MKIGISNKARFQHIYVVGGSGSGKTTLVQNFFIQDMDEGRGCGYIDPHGRAVEELLYYVPPGREVIYFEPTEYPMGLSFNATTDAERETALGDLMLIMRKLSHDSWGPQMDSILRFSFAALLSTPGTTFMDLYRIVRRDTDFILQLDLPDIVREYFEREFPKLKADALAPILSRLTPFLTSKTLGRIFQLPGTDFDSLLNSGTIFLCNLGKCGKDSANIIGTILMSQIQAATMRRRETATPFYLTVDEFHNFATSTFADLLRDARKFKVSLTLANQIFEDLDKSIQRALTGNIGETGTWIQVKKYSETDRRAFVWYAGIGKDVIPLETRLDTLPAPGKRYEPSRTAPASLSPPNPMPFNVQRRSLPKHDPSGSNSSTKSEDFTPTKRKKPFDL